MTTVPRWRSLLPPPQASISLALTLIAVVLGACGAEDAAGGPATPTGAASVLGDSYPRHADESTGFAIILGTPDLAVGANRVAFVLSDGSGLVRLPVVRVASYAPDGGTAAAQEASARFYAFPLGIRGVHVATLDFDRPGEWELEVRVPRPSGAVDSTRFPLLVAATSESPAVGDLAPASLSRTIDDVESLNDLSTGAHVDAALYALSIDEALRNGLPTMIVFASPGFCTNALCGPQVEVMSELRERYPDRANYVHVDLFENPVELQSGGLERAIRSPLLEQWGLRTDEWTFLVDADGRVTHRFEAFVSIKELEPALVSILAN